MKTYLLTLLLILSGLSYPVLAQSSDEIIVQKKGLGFAYYHNGRQISKKELLHVLESDPVARHELKKGYRNALPATLLTYAGGLLITYPMGKQLAGGHPNWLVSGAGAGLLTFSVPFAGAKMKREHQAIYAYNGGTHYAAKLRTDLRFGYALNRATVALAF
jgi:hypothetical protein